MVSKEKVKEYYDILHSLVGDRLLGVQLGYNGISSNCYDLLFESGRILHIDGPYDEGCVVYFEEVPCLRKSDS